MSSFLVHVSSFHQVSWLCFVPCPFVCQQDNKNYHSVQGTKHSRLPMIYRSVRLKPICDWTLWMFTFRSLQNNYNTLIIRDGFGFDFQINLVFALNKDNSDQAGAIICMYTDTHTQGISGMLFSDWTPVVYTKKPLFSYTITLVNNQGLIHIRPININSYTCLSLWPHQPPW